MSQLNNKIKEFTIRQILNTLFCTTQVVMFIVRENMQQSKKDHVFLF